MKHLFWSLLVASLTVSSASAQETKFEQLNDVAKKDFRGEPPTQAQIESAYTNCLADVDEEASSFKTGVFKKDHVNAETSICSRNRRYCVSNPRSVDCRAFVDDYAD